jgi:hypothetical protein
MIYNTQKKFAWTTLADVAPEYELYLRRKEAAMASNKISYIDEQDQSELIMATVPTSRRQADHSSTRWSTGHHQGAS